MFRSVFYAISVLTVFMIIQCSGQFANTTWESKYDYKVYQDRYQGTDVLEFGDGNSVKGTFSNPGLPPSIYTFTYTFENNVLKLINNDITPKTYTFKDNKIVSEDGNRVFNKK